ncbi:MAG TPA: hypothetical protein VFA33_29105 [Bryobacteraceae bacterium]|nr:hypothetical protein [Bryobacteraceae bacterium]
MRPFRPVLVSVLLVILTACGEAPEAYAPPPQRQAPEGSGYAYLGRYVHMNDINAEAYLVHDVAPAVESGAWRWTWRRPELRFYLRETAGLEFALDFAIADATFRQTGPVTLTLFLNGQRFSEVRCPRPGARQVRVPVPAGLAHANAVNTVVIQPDKVWVSPTDGAVLGFILSGAGFVP